MVPVLLSCYDFVVNSLLFFFLSMERMHPCINPNVRLIKTILENQDKKKIKEKKKIEMQI